MEEILSFPTAGIRSLGKHARSNLDMFEALCKLRQMVDEELAAAVPSLIGEHGATWTDIGARSGISRQGATKRWGHLIDGAAVDTVEHAEECGS